MAKRLIQYRTPNIKTMFGVTKAKTLTLLNAEHRWQRKAGYEAEPKLFRWLRHLFK